MIDLNRATKLADELDQECRQDPTYFITPDPRIEAAKTLRDLVLENSSLQLRVAMATECLALAERKLENVKGMVAALERHAAPGWKLVPTALTEEIADALYAGEVYFTRYNKHQEPNVRWEVCAWATCEPIAAFPTGAEAESRKELENLAVMWKAALDAAPQLDAVIPASGSTERGA